MKITRCPEEYGKQWRPKQRKLGQQKEKEKEKKEEEREQKKKQKRIK